MLKENSKNGKGSNDFSLLFEVDRINQLDLEFMKSEEFQDLLRQKAALNEQLINALSGELRAALINLCDTYSEISDRKQKFFYKAAFADSTAITQMLLGRSNINL